MGIGSHDRDQGWQRALLGLALAGLILGSWSCSSKQGPTEPAPPPEGIRLEDGNHLRWSSREAVRASVRYGFASGDYDHVAYPAATGRRDLALLTQHDVALLDLHEGETIYYQLVHQDENGQTTYGEEKSFTVETTPATKPLLTSTMIHIGWGDCHLLTMPTTGKRILIDAGEPGAASSVAQYFAQHGIDDLDAALATHVHSDHIGGLVGTDVDHDGTIDIEGAIARFDPETFLDSPQKVYFKSLYQEANQIVSEDQVQKLIVERGDDSDSFAEFASWDPEVYVTCLNSGLAPDVAVLSYEGTNINNESIVLRFSYGDVDLIIGGDCETECEGSIVDAFGAGAIESEYYKADHHGRFDGSSAKFVQAVRPRVSLVPVSWSEYGSFSEYLGQSSAAHSRLDAQGVDWYAIDDLPPLDLRESARKYNVSFVTDGISYEVRVEWALQSTKRAMSGSAMSGSATSGSDHIHDHDHGRALHDAVAGSFR